MANQTDNKQRVVAAALKRLEKLQRKSCFNPQDPESKPTKQQQSIIDEFGNIRTQWVISSVRSGKTATAGRIASWVLENNWENLPGVSESFKKKKKLLIFLGRTTKQLDTVQWQVVKSFLEPGTYTEKRTNEGVSSVHHENGNTIIFISFDQSRACRERLQGYTADFIWLDEMCGDIKVLSEAKSRLLTTSGCFLATFTPLIYNMEIKTLVENSSPPFSKKYKLSLLQNPLIANDPIKREEILREYAHLPEALRRTYLEGEWSPAPNRVFTAEENAFKDLPESYSYNWVHVEGSDPAAASKHGFVLLAQDPATQHWYVVRTEYIQKEDVIATIDYIAGITQPYNMVKRVADSANTYFIQLASRQGLRYTTPWDKNNRRLEMIEKVNIALGRNLFIPPHNKDLIDEIYACSYDSNESGRIINSHKWHVLDALRYIVDCLPPYQPPARELTYWQEIREKNQEARIKKLTKPKTPAKIKIRRRR